MSNNSRRLLSLLKILMKNSDRNHPLKENELKALLNGLDFPIANRKTIYSDIAALIDYGYDIHYDTVNKAYYLEEAPFSFEEARVLLDIISSINNIDESARTLLSDKIRSFISSYEVKTLTDNQILLKRKTPLKTDKKDQSYLDKIGIILEALSTDKKLSFFYNSKEQITLPYFLHYCNERYYLYVHFEGKDASYAYRVDRMSKLSLLNENFEFSINKLNEIKERIRTSYDSYDKNTPEVILLETEEPDTISNRLKDDFPDHYFNNKGQIVIEYRPNEIFYSKLASYGTSLKIASPDSVKDSYIEYLKTIINEY